jgi:hypothetical protein
LRRDYWDYYRTIEDDLITASRYVEFAPTNLSCYSIEFARLLLVTCSELDMVFKVLCKTINPNSRARTIGQYYKEITGRFDLTILKRYVRRFKLEVQPFIHWTQKEPPTWWSGYNKVKHERNKSFHLATLENTLDALAALQIALFHLYYLREKQPVGEFGITDLPRLLVRIPSRGDPDRDVHGAIIHFLQ